MSFQSVQQGIEKKEGVGSAAAGAILAKSTRNASPAAKKANPNLNKVKGKSKPPAAKPQWAQVADKMLGGPTKGC
jgi:hypothetical protein